ncbi:MAG: NosD domain-containing protein [Nevskia sp.]|nr:NosD domain-containing protein [Nevskia sp.]
MEHVVARPARGAVPLLALELVLGLACPITAAAQGTPQARLVGTYNGIPGQYTDIQSAVDAAQPGDYILVAPGDWHPSANGDLAGVYITTPNITLRGMDRNATIIDGTKPGGSGACSADPAAQDFGPLDGKGNPQGRNGIWVYRASGVWVENFTVCNFLGGSLDENGNQVWFDGKEDSTPIVLHSWYASYITASSSYFDTSHFGNYGLFTSTSDGPGWFKHTYASNMADSGYYIGACPDCNALIDDAHAQNNALGYSGTNSGGNLVIQNSEWDHNNSGIVTNTQSEGDPPPPQNGACPNGGTGPTGTHNCWVARNNYIHDNNNPNVPKVGLTAEGPVGAGLVIAGGRNDIVTGNIITNNGAWGILVTLFLDVPEAAGGTPPPPPGTLKQPDCSSGFNIPGFECVLNAFGNEISGNIFIGNGSFGNVTNGDIAEVSNPAREGNCWHDNVDLTGFVTSAPPLLQLTHHRCGIPNSGDPIVSPLALQVLCNTQALFKCPSSIAANYPRATQIQLMPIPANEPGLPDPCAGVPANPWCPAPAS